MISKLEQKYLLNTQYVFLFTIAFLFAIALECMLVDWPTFFYPKWRSLDEIACIRSSKCSSWRVAMLQELLCCKSCLSLHSPSNHPIWSWFFRLGFSPHVSSISKKLAIPAALVTHISRWLSRDTEINGVFFRICKWVCKCSFYPFRHNFLLCCLSNLFWHGFSPRNFPTSNQLNPVINRSCIFVIILIAAIKDTLQQLLY